MKGFDVFVIIILVANIAIPFVLDGSANKWANGVGWGLALMWFCSSSL